MASKWKTLQSQETLGLIPLLHIHEYPNHPVTTSICATYLDTCRGLFFNNAHLFFKRPLKPFAMTEMFSLSGLLMIYFICSCYCAVCLINLSTI